MTRDDWFALLVGASITLGLLLVASIGCYIWGVV
jgi:hypothetical protein